MLHRAEFAGIGCMKQHAAFVFMTDRILQQYWAEHAASMEKRDESVLQSWCDDDEQWWDCDCDRKCSRSMIVLLVLTHLPGVILGHHPSAANCVLTLRWGLVRALCGWGCCCQTLGDALRPPVLYRACVYTVPFAV